MWSCQLQQPGTSGSAMTRRGSLWGKARSACTWTSATSWSTCDPAAVRAWIPAPTPRNQWQRFDAQRLSVEQGGFRLHLDQCNVVINL